MVCVSCIIVPALLYIWNRFLQPIVLKFWNPWGKIEDQKDSNDTVTKPTCPMSKIASEPVNTDAKQEIIAGGKGKTD